jgi:hypothetical protein
MMGTGAGLDKKNAVQPVDARNKRNRAIHPFRTVADEPMALRVAVLQPPLIVLGPN